MFQEHLRLFKTLIIIALHNLLFFAFSSLIRRAAWSSPSYALLGGMPLCPGTRQLVGCAVEADPCDESCLFFHVVSFLPSVFTSFYTSVCTNEPNISSRARERARGNFSSHADSRASNIALDIKR